MTNPLTSWFNQLVSDLGEFARSFAPRSAGPAGTRRSLTKESIELQQAASSRESGDTEENDRYLQVMKKVFSPKNHLLFRQLNALPVFAAGRRMWEPGDTDANDEVAHTLIAKMYPLLKEAYGFNPARVVITDAIRSDLCGVYFPDKRIIHLRKRLFNDTFGEFFRTYIHEQIHCLQKDMMVKFELVGQRFFSEDEAYLIRRWLAEEPRKNSPGFYHRSGQEVHANWVARAVIAGD